MAHGKKCLLIVDDTEIDRIILKSILCRDFDIMEANSGNVAFEYITTKSKDIDGILLDIAMPHIDGFDVLKFMEDKGVTDIPVFLVTAEPTRENVERAMQFHVSDFIGKPFDRDEVLRRLRSRLGITPVYELTNDDLMLTKAYISDLETLYNNYMKLAGKDVTHYKVMVDLMHMLLTYYNKNVREEKLNADAIGLVSKAAYFCDIGEMMLPDRRSQIMSGVADIPGLEHSHTQFGSSFIRLNRAPSCEYFIEVCSSMCLHHHERYDGKGYPDGLQGDNNSMYNQMCRLVDEFETLRSKFYGDKSKPVKFVIRRLVNDDSGMVSPMIAAMLEDCEKQIVDYFMKSDL